MLKHVRHHKEDEEHGTLYEVDRATFKEFTASMGWTNPPDFPEREPALGGGPPAQGARNELMVKNLQWVPSVRKRSLTEAEGHSSREAIPRHVDRQMRLTKCRRWKAQQQRCIMNERVKMTKVEVEKVAKRKVKIERQESEVNRCVESAIGRGCVEDCKYFSYDFLTSSRNELYIDV